VTVNDPLGASPLVSGGLVFGGAPIGGLYAPVSDETAAGTLAAARDAGIRAFDTLPPVCGNCKVFMIKEFSSCVRW